MELWLPPSQTRPGFIGHCNVCGSDFGSRPAYTLHVVKCAEAHGQELLELQADVRRFNAAPDPEWQDYNEGLKAQGLDPEIQYARGRRSNIRRASES